MLNGENKDDPNADGMCHFEMPICAFPHPHILIRKLEGSSCRIWNAVVLKPGDDYTYHEYGKEGEKEMRKDEQRCGLCRFWYNGDLDRAHPNHHRGDYGKCFAPIPASQHYCAGQSMLEDDGKNCRSFLRAYKTVTFHDYTHQETLNKIDHEHWI